MTSSTAIVLQAGRGGRPFLQTADSILRSRRPAARTIIALSPAQPRPPLLESLTARLKACVISSLGDAAALVDTPYVLFLREGDMLDDVGLEECEAIFAGDPSAAAIAPSIRLQTVDASAHLVWRPAAATAAAVLNDTRSVPAVFAVRREVFDTLGGFDEVFAELASYEFWLRLTLAQHKVIVLEEPLIARDISLAAHEGPPYTAAAHKGPPDTATPPDGAPHTADVGRPFMGRHDDARHLELFRTVLEKHAAAIEEVMHDVLVAREVRFGQLREMHRELMARRDAGLAELDRLRAEAVHERAYVVHHRRDDVDWGDLRRTDPISRDWGYDRGLPIDRRYIEEFLCAHSSDVRGSVLEIQEDDFTRACGGPRVTSSDVLDIDDANPRASILADLRCAPGIAADRFDCIILTQTLHVIDDMAAVLGECHRILKPGGVLLATIPAASRVCLEYGRDGDFWRATPAGARSLFRNAFAPSAVTTSEFGNVLTNVAFLQGVAAGEIAEGEFVPRDPYFPALTGVRARKSASPPPRAARGIVLLYHRVEETSGIHDLSVPAALFEAQLAWLGAQCAVIPLEMLLESPPESLPPRAVALTFDDGYVDNLSTVAPLLQKYQLPATFFLTTRWLEEEGEYWWDLLERAAPSDEEAARLHDQLVHATLEQRDAQVRELKSRRGTETARVRPMIGEEIRQLASYANVTIGAHSVNHLALPDQDAGVICREVEDSCEALARLLGRPVTLFAYPYGAYDRTSAAVVRSSCRWGISCDQRPLTESFDAAAVPRLEVKRWSVSELAARINRDLTPRPSGHAS